MAFHEKEIKMGINQLGEKFNKIHNSSLKSTQVLGKMASESARNISQTHASVANHVAKNLQMTAANLMTSKSPEEIWKIMNGSGSTPFLEEMKVYQESLQKSLNDYLHEFSEVNDELFEDAKDGLDEFFKVACQNAPDGPEAFIRPCQSAFNACFDGMQKMQQLMTGYLDSIGGGMSQLNQKPLASLRSRKSHSSS
jgi:hypothetical protein